MLATRDQENLVHGHQQVAASKPLNQNTRALPPKTPGNKYPKTPLKINLNDENEPTAFGGGKVLGTKGKGLENLVTGGKKGAAFDKNAFVTPLGPQNRAPLGAKTTNAKAKAFQTPAGPALDKEPQKTQAKPTSVRRPKPRVSHAETLKLDIHGDESDPLEEREVEYGPPKPKDLPYESDVFPDGCLDLECLKAPNLLRGWRNYYLNPVDEDGVSRKEKAYEKKLEKIRKEADERILKAVEELDWTVGDMPETFAHLRIHDHKVKEQTRSTIREQGNTRPVTAERGPATITSRRAASALSMAPREPLAVQKARLPSTTSKTPVPFLSRGKKATPIPQPNPSTMRHNIATAASRSTIGYNKGRSASSVLNMRAASLARSASNVSNISDSTITPTSYAQKQNSEDCPDDWTRLQFLEAFGTDDEELEPALRGELPECLRRDENADEDFVLTLNLE